MPKSSSCLSSFQLRLFKRSLMYTSFNDNQNLPKTGNEPEATPILQLFKQRQKANESLTLSFQLTLPQIVWLVAVNRAIINFKRNWYEYIGNSAVKSLILKFIKGIPPSKRDFIVAICDCSSKKPQSFATESFILAKNGVYWAKNFSLRKRKTNHGRL